MLVFRLISAYSQLGFQKFPMSLCKRRPALTSVWRRRGFFPSLLFSFIPPVLRSLLKDRKTQQTHEENGHGICI